jgi:hypothetical protein
MKQDVLKANSSLASQKKVSAFLGTWKLRRVFTRACHISTSQGKESSPHSHITFIFKCILILFSHAGWGIPFGLLPSGMCISYHFHACCMLCPHCLLSFVTLTVFCAEYKLRSSAQPLLPQFSAVSPALRSPHPLFWSSSKWTSFSHKSVLPECNCTYYQLPLLLSTGIFCLYKCSEHDCDIKVSDL